MPIDPSIPLQFRPTTPLAPAPNPLESLARVLQIKNAIAQQPLIEQQVQEGTLNLQEARRKIGEREALNKAYTGAVETDPDTGLPRFNRDKLSQALSQSGHADQIPTVMESLDKTDKSRADLRDAQQKVEAGNVEYGAGIGAATRAAGNDPGFFRAKIAVGIGNKNISPQTAAPILKELDAADQQDPTGEASKAVVKKYSDALIASSEKMITAQSGASNAAAGQAKLPGELAAQAANLPKLKADALAAQQAAAGTKPIQPAEQATIDAQKATRAATDRHNQIMEQQGAGRLAVEQKKLALTTGGVPLTATQQSIADKLASGDFNPAQLSRFPDKEALISAAVAKNPNWSPQTYATKKAFEDPQSKQSQNLGTISRIVGHIGRFEKNSNELGTSPSFFTGVNLSGKAAATHADAHAISSELEKLVSGGVGTEGQVREWQKSLTSSMPEIRQQAIDEISQLIGSQYEGMNQTYKTTIGSDLPIEKYVSPGAREWMKAKGINTTGAAAPAALQPTHTLNGRGIAVDPKSNAWVYVDNGKPAQ